MTDDFSSRRWGPSLLHGLPSIEIPRDWRDRAAAFPHEKWCRWRKRSLELQQSLGRPTTAEDIGEADRRAFNEIS